jgi:hypothetical protein
MFGAMRWWLIGLLLAPVAAAGDEPCCGPITPHGRQLEQLLDGSGVDHLWLAGWHIDWRTGETDRDATGGPEAKTHCSAFAAAMAERVRAYVLRPPEHRQELLANAQMRWLRDQGGEQGWHALDSPVEAQAAANRGELVLQGMDVIAQRATAARHPRAGMMPEPRRRGDADGVLLAGLGFLRTVLVECRARLVAGAHDRDVAGLVRIGIFERLLDWP